VNALLGGVVVTIGAWLAWDKLTLSGSLLIFLAVLGFLIWRGKTVALVWAWSTLLLGIESFAWPLLTMLQIRSATDQPSDEQMGTILSAILMGLFSSVFWIAFSYGLFKRRDGTEPASSSDATPRTAAQVSPQPTKKR
jgi:hypothetical protein